ncbi:polyserase-2-like [Aedes albopictus]|uniref:Peptidase S1 domain-containing protein n=1 Tax=Aedes albopictus TaxID=7160 RepID=A0ABM2A4B0_AEDAL
MNQRECFLILCFLCLMQFSDTSYQCGIRLHGLRPLIKDGRQAEEGQWPWHVAVFNRLKSTDRFKYGCGGTLVNEKHTLTAAHCVKRLARGHRPPVLYEIELHFGQHNLSKLSDNVVVRDVSKIHVHPEYEPNKNDIAMLVMRLPVEYSDTVIPICLDQEVDRELQALESKPGWIAGWGMTENGTISDVLRTASLSMVSHLTCLQNDPNLFGNCLNEKVFCAGNKTGSSPGPGDSGGGMYISDGDRWQLRGIISFGKFNELKKSIDTSKYIVFVNVQWYLTWVKEILEESEPSLDKRQKRISELECDRFQTLTKKRPNGDCLNIYMHNVMVIKPNTTFTKRCNGVLVDESHVITTCSCVRPKGDARYLPAKVQIEAYGEVDVAEMICHPKHTDHSQHYDLAILKLDATLMLSNTRIPACLANNWTENLYDILVQTSYVTNRFDNHKILVELNENKISLYEKCKSLHRPEWFNRSDLIGELCVNSTDQLMYNAYHELTSSYSSGAVLQTSNRQSCISTAVGLKVHIEKTDEYSFQYWMGIYARIAYHLDWLEQNIWNGQSEDFGQKQLSDRSSAATATVAKVVFCAFDLRKCPIRQLLRMAWLAMGKCCSVDEVCC